MDTIELLYVITFGFVFVVFAFLIGYALNPIKRARIQRLLLNRNYGVVVIRGKGGHTIFKVHDFNKITFTYGSGEHAKTYTINEEYIDRTGTVPLIYFQVDDANPATLNPAAQKKIPPEALNSVVLLIKALHEAKTQLTQRKTLILMLIILAFTVIGCVLSFYSLMKVGELEALTHAVGNTCASITTT